MLSSAYIGIPIAAIRVGERLRAVEPAAVENLKVSITESGWFGGILVRPIESEEGEARYDLVAGAHRLAAMKSLGRPTIPATIRTLTDDEARQIEIDENLVRRGLTPLERAEMVAARFQVWSRRFPERVIKQGEAAKPKRGRPSNSAKFAEFLGGAPQAMGFAAETAADVGLSKRTVEAAWTVVNGLPEALRLQIRGTQLAKNEGLLRQLAAIGDKAEQAKVAEVLISGRTKNVADARAIVAGNVPTPAKLTTVDESLKAFRAVWAKATPSARAAILDELAGKKLPDGYAVTRSTLA